MKNFFKKLFQFLSFEKKDESSNEQTQSFDFFKNYLGMGAKKDDPLDGLKSLDTRKKENKKKVFGRIGLLLVLIPLVFFILQVLVKSGMIIYGSDKTEITKKIPKKDIKLEINSFTKWQAIKDKKDQQLDEKIDVVKDELKKDINTSRELSNKKIDDVKSDIMNQMKQDKEDFTTKLDSAVTSLKNISAQQSNEMNNKVNTLKKDFQAEIKKEIKNRDSKALTRLPELPPLQKPHDLTIIEPKKEEITKPQEEYVVQEEVIQEGSFSVSTLDDQNESTTDKDTLPSFTLMPGFAKGVIVAGANVPTMQANATDAKPVWISINSDALIANNDFMNLKDCLVLATATGDLISSRALIRLSKLSCSMTDFEGKKYKIEQKIEGWVYGEEGTMGVKGRLVSKEGEIIKKGIPLALVEGAINMLSKTNNYAIFPNGLTTQTATSNPLQEFTNGGATGTTKILNKFSEYYLKILENLNPYVEVKVKREVTIAFKGGEKLTPVEYLPFNVNHLETEGLANVN